MQRLLRRHDRAELPIRVREQNGVVNRRTQLHRVDHQIAQVIQAVSRKIGHAQIDDDGAFDGSHQQTGHRSGSERDHQH